MTPPEPARARPPVIAAVAAVVLAILVAYVGTRYQPSGTVRFTSSWDFRAAVTPSWRVLGGEGHRTEAGLMVVPTEAKAPAIGSDRIALDAGQFSGIRIRFSTRSPLSGNLWLVVDHHGERRSLPFPFHGRGGAEEEVVIPLGSNWAPKTTFQGVVVIPSGEPQVVTLSSIAFDRREGSVAGMFRDLVAPWPGEAASRERFAINGIPPPLVNGRSLWAVVVPVVLLAGSVAALIGAVRAGPWSVVRRIGWAVVGLAWVLGTALTLYHQSVAWRLDVSRFAGLSRSDAYAVIDGLPLWDDFERVARLVPSRATLDVVVEGQDPEEQGFWRHRAAYYLYPIVVHSQAPIRIRYFGGSHRPCALVEPDATVLSEAERYCVFRWDG